VSQGEVTPGGAGARRGAGGGGDGGDGGGDGGGGGGGGRRGGLHPVLVDPGVEDGPVDHLRLLIVPGDLEGSRR